MIRKELLVRDYIRETLKLISQKLNEIDHIISMVGEPEQLDLLPEETNSATLIPIEAIQPISTRLRCACERLEVETLGDVLKLGEAEFRRHPNVGKRTIRELKDILANHGLALTYYGDKE